MIQDTRINHPVSKMNHHILKIHHCLKGRVSPKLSENIPRLLGPVKSTYYSPSDKRTPSSIVFETSWIPQSQSSSLSHQSTIRRGMHIGNTSISKSLQSKRLSSWVLGLGGSDSGREKYRFTHGGQHSISCSVGMTVSMFSVFIRYIYGFRVNHTQIDVEAWYGFNGKMYFRNEDDRTHLEDRCAMIYQLRHGIWNPRELGCDLELKLRYK